MEEPLDTQKIREELGILSDTNKENIENGK